MFQDRINMKTIFDFSIPRSAILVGDSSRLTSTGRSVLITQLELEMSKDDSPNHQIEDLLTPQVLQNRIDAGLGVKGGARGSFTKVVDELQMTESGAPCVHLELFRLELRKLFLIHQRNQREIERLRAENDTPIDVSPVSELRAERNRMKTVAACLGEYEALAKVIVEKHTVSEHALQLELQDLQNRMSTIQEQADEARAAARVRSSQFHLLQQCINDLNSSLEQPLRLEEEEKQVARNERATKPEATAMDVDEEEEGELYGDLG